jgi:hypothetical protein
MRLKIDSAKWASCAWFGKVAIRANAKSHSWSIRFLSRARGAFRYSLVRGRDPPMIALRAWK